MVDFYLCTDDFNLLSPGLHGAHRVLEIRLLVLQAFDLNAGLTLTRIQNNLFIKGLCPDSGTQHSKHEKHKLTFVLTIVPIVQSKQEQPAREQ